MHTPHHLYLFIYQWTFRLLPYLGSVGVHVSFWIIDFSEYMPRSEITGPYGNFIFSFSKNLHIVLHSGCTSLHFHQQCRKDPFPTPSPTFIYRLSDDAHSDWCQVIVALIYISLIIFDVEYLFRCLLAICMSSLEKCLFRSLTHFLIILFVFLILNHTSCYKFWRLIPCRLHGLHIFSLIWCVIFFVLFMFHLLCKSL